MDGGFIASQIGLDLFTSFEDRRPLLNSASCLTVATDQAPSSPATPIEAQPLGAASSVGSFGARLAAARSDQTDALADLIAVSRAEAIASDTGIASAHCSSINHALASIFSLGFFALE
jgi:hypothetical protein